MPLQAGLFSAALTSFVVDSKQNLQVSPSDKMVYYLEQHSTILSQISQQIASIAPEVSIPSTPPPPFPSFSPSASDIRINAFWFMALAFSLSAALLAILVQQWVRDYMHVFQRYSDLQKSARMRQYLYEGSEGWYMPIAAEAVPGLLHVSLFLFFAGLADTTLNINTAIGVSTTVPIGICGLLYIFTTLAPVIYPQSPYQTSFSGVIWYAVQKLRGRRFKDRDGESKSVSTNMAQGQMQLSMEKTKERNGRDKRAILWLLDNLTEDAEIESFVMSASRSLEVWTELSKEDVMSPPPKSSSHLSRICCRLQKAPYLICNRFRKIRDSITHHFWMIHYWISHPLWTIRYLIQMIRFSILHQFRRIRNVLGSIPRWFKPFNARHSSANALVNQRAFQSVNAPNPIVIPSIHERTTIREFCWRIGHFFDTCKNRATFASDELWRMRARACVEVMASLVFKADAELGWFGDTLQVLGDIGEFEGMHNLSSSRKDEAFVVRWTCLWIMEIGSALNRRRVLNYPDNRGYTVFRKHILYSDPLEKTREMDETLEHRLGTYECQLSSKISFAADTMQTLNLTIAPEWIDEVVLRMARQLPGVHLDFPDSEPFLRQSLDIFCDPPKLQFLCRQQPPNKFLDFLKRIETCPYNSSNSEYEQVIEKVIWPKHVLQRSAWSFIDFCEGGLGLAVELFLLSLKQLLSTYPSQESYSTLFIGTFRAITSDRRRYARQIFDPIQNILLDVVASEQGLLRTFNYPDYITDEVWELLGDVLAEGQAYYDIDSVVRQLTDLQREVGGRYGAKAEAVISRLRPSHSQGPSAPTGSE